MCAVEGESGHGRGSERECVVEGECAWREGESLL